MQSFDAADLELLTDEQLWRYGSCFELCFTTYPRHISRLCGHFYWRYPAENIEQVVALYSELIDLVRRLHTTLHFSGVVMRIEADPWFDVHPSELSGIAIFDWVAEAGNFNVFEYLEPCYAVLPLQGVPHPNGSMKLLYRA